jgi:hypothetical protein
MRTIPYSILWERMCPDGVWCGESYVLCDKTPVLIQMPEGSVLGDMPTEAEVRAVAGPIVESLRFIHSDEAIRIQWATSNSIISVEEI